MMKADQHGVWDDNRYYSSSYSCYEKCRRVIRKGVQNAHTVWKNERVGTHWVKWESLSSFHLEVFDTFPIITLSLQRTPHVICAGTSEEFSIRTRKAWEKWCILFLNTRPGETLVSSSTCHHWTLPFRKAVQAKFRSIPEDKKKFNALYTLFKDKSESDEVI